MTDLSTTIPAESKAEIDAMSHEQLAWVWRFAPIGHHLLAGDTGKYFRSVFDAKGGMTPELSKKLGWGR